MSSYSLRNLICRYLHEGKFDYAYVLYLFAKRKVLKLSEIVSILKSLGFNKDVRTIHRWLNRLCQKRILERVERGIYKLNDRIDFNIGKDLEEKIRQAVNDHTTFEIEEFDLEENTVRKYDLPDLEQVVKQLNNLKPGLGQIVKQLIENDELYRQVQQLVRKCEKIKVTKANK